MSRTPQKQFSSSISMNVTKGTSLSAQKTNHLSQLYNSSAGLNANLGGLLQNARSGKFKRAEEGLEGLPMDAKPAQESDYENADSCFSCEKELAKSLGLMRKKGRHHCRRCARTVCNNCWKNERRISQNDKKTYKVCDQCDFELSNYQLLAVLDQIQFKEKTMQSVLEKKNEVLDEEIQTSKAQRIQLQKDLEQKQDEFEQMQNKTKIKLQTLNHQYERQNSELQMLSDKQKQEYNKRQGLQQELSNLNIKEQDMQFNLQQIDQSEQSVLRDQRHLIQQMQIELPEEVFKQLQEEFEEIKLLTDSQILEKSDFLLYMNSEIQNKSQEKDKKLGLAGKKKKK
ncbi:fyve zinc finger family protein [Stylonychia lemnae]|uniref:Fyve zinc finger family protein n=1 Tax=Stylonychia lemnae TaxID=5949 RepID=A0A078AEG7_STYLE|nr:fyve zinc finger family protein [Stylonychia lemnae]|eukprot:CDW80664.1 fyve zinc finger family protein [Stylonychia lemnae]